MCGLRAWVLNHRTDTTMKTLQVPLGAGRGFAALLILLWLRLRSRLSLTAGQACVPTVPAVQKFISPAGNVHTPAPKSNDQGQDRQGNCEVASMDQIKSDELNRILTLESQYTGAENRDLTVRQSVRNLPCQPFFTWLSGVPLSGSTSPKFTRKPWMHVLDSVALAPVLIAGAGCCLAAGGAAAWAAVPLMLIATGRCRKVAMTVQHQIAHSHLLEIERNVVDAATPYAVLTPVAKAEIKKLSKTVNGVVSHVCTSVFWIASLREYIESHAKNHHNAKDLATPTDEDATAFYGIGFTPGKSVRSYWLLLAKTLLNPWFYLRGCWGRFKQAFGSTRTGLEKVSSIFVMVLLLGALAAGGTWMCSAVMYLAVLFLLVPAAALLQQISEHLWGCYMELLTSGQAGKRVELVCQGRFNLDRFPSQDVAHRWSKILVWWLRLPYHIAVRLIVLPGDLSAHAVHHLHCHDLAWIHAPSWTLSAYQTEPERYRHCWSIGKAIARVFHAMSLASIPETKSQPIQHP